MKRTQIARGMSTLTRSPMKRSGRLKARRPSKKAMVDGASEREIRDECDELVRRIIEIRDRRCVVCGTGRNFVRLDVGHFIKRGILAVRWSLENCHAQCSICNQKHNAFPKIYRRCLVKEISEIKVAELERIAKENPRLEYSDLLTIRNGLRAELEKVRELK